jgi:hypothetical protein
MQFPIEATILKRAYISQKECCNISRNITISNEEVSSQKKHFSKIISILCQTVVHWHCWHAASSTNASCHLANTSCHLANTSCHLANTSCCLANLYVYIKRKRKPKKKQKNIFCKLIRKCLFVFCFVSETICFMNKGVFINMLCWGISDMKADWDKKA